LQSGHPSGKLAGNYVAGFLPAQERSRALPVAPSGPTVLVLSASCGQLRARRRAGRRRLEFASLETRDLPSLLAPLRIVR